MVSHITEQGYLKFRTIGGWDPIILVGQRVVLQTQKGAIYGVIGRTPIHLLDPQEREKAPKLEQLFIDIGAKDGKAAKKIVEVGDVGVIASEPLKLQGNRLVVRGADDRLGAFVVAEAMRIAAEKKKELKAALFSVATVQEEVGLRGAKTVAFGLDPAVGIAVDVGFATDHPGADPAKTGEAKLGLGPIVAKGANINPKVNELLVSIAKKKRIKIQKEGIPGATGTDANVIQMTRAGVATGLVSIPLRYMHSPVEVLDTSDLEGSANLLAEFALSLKPDMDFTP
jgi:endoglucanase